MLKKFTKKDLLNKLGMSEERANLVMKAQKEFPEILQEENTKDFIIDARNLWLRLDKPQGEFNKWIKRKLLDKNYKENIDYIKVDNFVEVGNLQRPQTDYTLKLNSAKKVAMRENTDKGDRVCDYFIYLEEAIKDINNWMVIREPQKYGYKEMTSAIDKQYEKTHDGKKANSFIYSNNADMINLCLFGYKSKKMKEILEIDYNEPLRDNLVSKANKCLYELQILNQSLLLSNIDFATRKLIIQNTCNEKYIGIRVKVVSEFSKELKEIN